MVKEGAIVVVGKHVVIKGVNEGVVVFWRIKRVPCFAKYVVGCDQTVKLSQPHGR